MTVVSRSSNRNLAWLALVFALVTGCAYVDVPPGHVAVNWTVNGMSDKVYKEGEYGIGFYDRATVFDARSQEREEKLNVLASNGLRIVLDASIRYHIVPEDAVKLAQELVHRRRDRINEELGRLMHHETSQLVHTHAKAAQGTDQSYRAAGRGHRPGATD